MVLIGALPLQTERMAKVGCSGMARRSLLVALACVVLGAAVWLVAARTGWGARLDSAGLEGFTGLATPERERVADVVSRSVDPTPFVVIGAAVTCIALARRRLREALAVIVMLAGGSYTAQLLQSLLAGPRPHPAVDFRVGEAAWPSGHTAAALGLRSHRASQQYTITGRLRSKP